MARFGITKNEDNTGRVITHDIKEPAYSATLSLNTNASKTYVTVGALTGALTLNTVDTNCQKYDELFITFTASGANRIVTFGTNFLTAGTLTVVSAKFGTVHFVYNGADWVEFGRALTV
jgi:hypothetical protein